MLFFSSFRKKKRLRPKKKLAQLIYWENETRFIISLYSLMCKERVTYVVITFIHHKQSGVKTNEQFRWTLFFSFLIHIIIGKHSKSQQQQSQTTFVKKIWPKWWLVLHFFLVYQIPIGIDLFYTFSWFSINIVSPSIYIEERHS